MNKILMAACSMVVGVAIGMAEAEAAKRLGGGRSVGTQREAVQQQPRQTPQQSQQQSAAQPGKAATAAAPAAGAAAGNRWFGPVAGLLAGGLLGAMIFGGAFEGIKFMDIVMILLLAAGIFFVFRMMRKPQPQTQRPEPMRYAGAGNVPRVEPHAAQPMSAANAPVAPVGNYFPAGFDAEGFGRQAKLNFTRMQEANDRADLTALREMMTPELFKEIEAEIRARGGVAQQTEVVTLEAQVLEVVTEGAHYIASVRFTGLMKDEPAAQPEHFSEIWHLQKALNGKSGWLMAGIQQA